MENKAILMSIQPKWVAKILNGEKTIEVRKKFPKDYEGWVYIYCTKAKPSAHIWTMKVKEKPYKVIFSKTQYQQETDLDEFMNVEFIEKYPQYAWERIICHPEHINGYVVARFWCDKVSVIERYCGTFIPINGYTTFLDKRYSYEGLKQATCLNDEELHRYLGNKNGYAIHISKLEIFNKPMLLTMFRKPEFNKNIYDKNSNRLSLFERLRRYSITKAPQSWCYVEE